MAAPSDGVLVVPSEPVACARAALSAARWFLGRVSAISSGPCALMLGWLRLGGFGDEFDKLLSCPSLVASL